MRVPITSLHHHRGPQHHRKKKSNQPTTIFQQATLCNKQRNQLTMRSIFSVLNRTAATAWQPPTRTLRSPRTALKLDSICARCRQHQIRFSSNNRQLADDPRWISVVDHPAQVVRAGRKHGPGLIILGIAPMLPATLKWTMMMLIVVYCSFNSYHLIRPRNLASPAPRLENKPDHKIRGPSS